ncbi:hypothetical protein UFOVP1217_84 [uncultured Caudovirales phage]|uniref:Uncharacterized protein n=1 Tax=uncultured Caudovirales phage TaxID=2100421 RepID=A0A6J5NAF5_9CAUD|nr:hypothetical protein UFOVP465_162 [uncultured Caudovirales phage]CAB4155717.1 hypothetical protein UFOVP666_20 [uncultured Caudovirales phage]CAB4160227.1 hypothetical protein UFOVP727_97 [uncultured Caudovirales phage]CAB4164654.1 hypothetical protein UFOVP819_48 [uncultured Caudovirales phage]CAB4172089.1 hypothetical protein UFOVP926_39 [uncultured Caudovirales phage]
MTVPVTDLMHGAQWAKYYVNQYLTADLPNRINRYRSGWNLDSNELPTPEFFLTYEPIALDHWPTIITICLSTSPFERMMQGRQGDPLYRVTYSMRTYIWAKTEGSEAVTLLRDRLTTVLRSALMDKPCLTQYDSETEADIYIDESSLREEFSDLTLIKGDRVLAGAYLGYDLILNEVIYRDQIAAITGYNIEKYNMRSTTEGF